MSQQYQGWCHMEGIGYIPVNSIGLELTEAKNYPNNIHGGGTLDQSAGPIHWSFGQSTFTGDVEVVMTEAYGLELLQCLIGTERDTYRGVTIHNGERTWYYEDAKCSTLTLSGNMGGIVTARFGLTACANGKSYVRTSTGGASAPTISTWAADEYNPIPYYRSEFFGAAESAKATTWEITINNNLQDLFTFNGLPYLEKAQATWRGVTGTYTIYDPGSSLPTDPELGQKTIILKNAAGNTTVVTITLGNVILDTYQEPLTDVGSKLFQNRTFTSLTSATTANIAFA